MKCSISGSPRAQLWAEKELSLVGREPFLLNLNSLPQKSWLKASQKQKEN